MLNLHKPFRSLVIAVGMFLLGFLLAACSSKPEKQSSAQTRKTIPLAELALQATPQPQQNPAAAQRPAPPPIPAQPPALNALPDSPAQTPESAPETPAPAEITKAAEAVDSKMQPALDKLSAQPAPVDHLAPSIPSIPSTETAATESSAVDKPRVVYLGGNKYRIGDEEYSLIAAGPNASEQFDVDKKTNAVKLYRATGNVSLSNKEMSLECTQLEYDSVTEELSAQRWPDKPLTLIQGGLTATADRLHNRLALGETVLTGNAKVTQTAPDKITDIFGNSIVRTVDAEQWMSLAVAGNPRLQSRPNPAAGGSPAQPGRIAVSAADASTTSGSPALPGRVAASAADDPTTSGSPAQPGRIAASAADDPTTSGSPALPGRIAASAADDPAATQSDTPTTTAARLELMEANLGQTVDLRAHPTSGTFDVRVNPTGELDHFVARHAVTLQAEKMDLECDVLEFLEGGDKIIATGESVAIRQGDKHATCQRFEHDPRTKKSILTGSTRRPEVIDPAQTARADTIIFTELENGEIDVSLGGQWEIVTTKQPAAAGESPAQPGRIAVSAANEPATATRAQLPLPPPPVLSTSEKPLELD